MNLEIFQYDTFGQIEFANLFRQHLVKSYEDFITKVTSGAFIYNDVVKHVGNTNAPFGGVGSSGYGKISGKFGFEEFSHFRSVNEHYPVAFIDEILTPPFTDKKTNMMSSGIKMTSRIGEIRYKAFEKIDTVKQSIGKSSIGKVLARIPVNTIIYALVAVLSAQGARSFLGWA